MGPRLRSHVIASLVAVLAAAGVLVVSGNATAADPPSVRVTPGISGVVVGGERQLTSVVTGLSSTDVAWTVRSGPGSVSATGLYSAPAQALGRRAVVRATSTEDPSRYGEATLTLASGVAGPGFDGARAVTDGATRAESGDVTGDGVEDVVRLQGLANGLTVFRLVTTSVDGSGNPVSTVGPTGSLLDAGDDYVYDLDLGDVDADGDQDAVVAFGGGADNAQKYRYQVFRNNGTGTWAADPKATSPTGARSGHLIELVDFDGDGKLDLVGLERFGTVTLQKGSGAGGFAEPVSLFGVPGGGSSFSVGDLTGDGRPDVAVGTQSGPGFTSDSVTVGLNDGFGNIAREYTLHPGINPEPTIYDASGDGWNDLVVAYGGDHFTFHPARLVSFRNLATGDGSVAASSVQLGAIRPYGLEPVHVDGDAELDLAGLTYRGPFLARRTAPDQLQALHSGTAFSPAEMAAGDYTGDGRVDVYVANDGSSAIHPGSSSTAYAASIDPTVTFVNATHQARFTAAVRNARQPVTMTWSASRGSFDNSVFGEPGLYTAPSSAPAEGVSVEAAVSVAGEEGRATRSFTVVNDQYSLFSLGGTQVRQVVADTQAGAGTLYAATSAGVQRSTSNGTSFSPLGPGGPAGSDARALTVVRDGGLARVLAAFGTNMYSFDLVTQADWVPTGPAGVTGVSAAPGSPVAFAVAGGQIHRTTDLGTSWSALGGSSITGVTAISPTEVWVTRSVAPRLMVGTVTDGTLTLADRSLPGDPAVTALAVRPADRHTAYVATGDASRRLFRGHAASGPWTQLPLPDQVDRLSVAPGTGHLLAARSGTGVLLKSRDDGASWYSAARGFPNTVAMSAVGHRTDGRDLVGTGNGLFLPSTTTAPAAPTVTAGPTGTTGPGSANSFSFAFTGSGSSYLCALDDKAWNACTSPKAYSGPLSEGEHTFSVVAVDAAGYESTPATRSWTVDATPPPPPEVTDGPAAVTNQSQATFAFTLGGDAAGALCRLDGGTATACTSPRSYTGLTHGSHTFEVMSVDQHGNRSSAASRTWQIDTQPPAFPGFWARPGFVAPDGNAFFGWSTDAGATYQCLLDDDEVACADGTYSVEALTDGFHHFSVTAADAAGNTSTNGWSWEVDSTPPGAPSLTAAPPALSGTQDARFEFLAGEDAHQHTCTLDDGQPQYCSGAMEYAGLAEGEHTFSVRAYDGFGRASEAVTHRWTIAVEPEPAAPVLQSGPTGHVASRSASFTYSVTDGQTARCSLDGSEPSACPSTGTSYADLDEGAHTFAVRAVSPGGRVSAPTTASWTVDVTAPGQPAFSGKPPLRTTSRTASFTWPAAAAGGYECSVDDEETPCGATGVDLTGLAEGQHTFRLVEVDLAENRSAAAVHQWTVDRTGPTVTVSDRPETRTKNTSAQLAFGSTAPDLAATNAWSCTLDGVAVPCGTGTLSLTGLAEGVHTVVVSARDDLGNEGPAVTVSWTVDLTSPVATVQTVPDLEGAPSITFDEPVDGVDATTVALVGPDGPDGGPVVSSLVCRDSDAAVTDCEAGAVHSVTVRPQDPLVPGGRYAVRVNGAVDEVGNMVHPTVEQFRASVDEPESSPAARATWRKVTDRDARGRSYTVSDDKGATTEYAFSGPEVTWYAPAGPGFGKADVAVDGEHVASYSFYAGRERFVAKTIDGLRAGEHSLTITVRGEKGGRSGRGTAVGVDGFRVGGVAISTPPVEQAWGTRSATLAQGGRYAAEDDAGAAYRMTFYGTGVHWRTVLGPAMGMAHVRIDGGPAQVVDLFASKTKFARLRSWTGLEEGLHTLTISVLGRGRPAAKGTTVAVDGLLVD